MQLVRPRSPALAGIPDWYPRTPKSPAAGALAAAGLVAVVAGAVAALLLASNPAPALAILAFPALLMIGGPELPISLLLLGGAGVLPFFNPEHHFGSTPLWLLAFGAAAALALLTWCGRRLAGREAWPLRGNALLAAVAVLLAYTLHRLASGSPNDIPSVAAVYLVFPVAGLVTYLWLSHADATENLRRILPLVALIVAAWLVVYLVAATGQCHVCSRYVSSAGANNGLLGPTSRLYTDGGAVVSVAAFVGLAAFLRRPSARLLVFTGLCIAFQVIQAGRASYLGFAAGLAVLLAWYVRRSSAAARVLAVVAVALGVWAVVVSPVGQRIASGYQDLTQDTGTPGYRVALIRQNDQYWSVFGQGVSGRIVDEGLTTDLGIPNTFLVLGYVGGALEVVVLLIAVGRGLRAGSPIGATLAATFVMVLVTRPTLPNVETGPAAMLFGTALGVAAALPVPRRGRAALSVPRRASARAG